jgi:hypothetical protein
MHPATFQAMCVSDVNEICGTSAVLLNHKPLEQKPSIKKVYTQGKYGRKPNKDCKQLLSWCHYDFWKFVKVVFKEKNWKKSVVTATF